jgi:hypothetical protein
MMHRLPPPSSAVNNKLNLDHGKLKRKSCKAAVITTCSTCSRLGDHYGLLVLAAEHGLSQQAFEVYRAGLSDPGVLQQH